MKMRLHLLAAAVVVGTASAASQVLLPKPQHVTWHSGYFDTHRPIRVIATSQADSLLKVANWQLGTQDSTQDGRRGRLAFFVFEKTGERCLGDGAYTLHVGRDTVKVVASTADGFRYAHATFRQLLTSCGYACATIQDAPAMAWRGAMLDVSRHFFPIDFLYKQIDALATYKFNRLHLHLTDAAGWRMEIKRYPLLTQLAAWRTNASWKEWWNGDRRYVEEGTGGYGGYYTQNELRHLVSYAASRGITIVPEIEMPAHSEEVLAAYPELSCTHEPYKQADFCPGNEQTFVFLENVLQEVMEVFPSVDLHIGGDEAGKASWGKCPLCHKRMVDERLGRVEELQGYLVRRIGCFLHQAGRRLIGWDEVLADSLPAEATVMIWRDTAYVRQAIARGHDVVLSPGTFCYLDGYQDAPTALPEAMGGYLPLERVYNYAPLRFLTPGERRHVRGIQGNLWTEYVPTTADVDRQWWPRLLAVAETGWTGDAVKDYADFHRRALHETARLRENGIAAYDLAHEVGDRPESKRLVRHKARGATVTYNLPYNEKYASTGNTALTDGRRGGWDYGPESAWQGFIRGARFDVTIDLGRVKRFKRVATNFMQSSGPEIFLPAAYTVSVSSDGSSFTEVGHHEYDVTKRVTPSVETLSWKGKARARYIRIQARSGQFGGWIFADEVEVY